MQKQFTIVSHQEDIKLTVESSSLENLFKTSLLGMGEVLKKDFGTSMDGLLVSSEIELSSNSTPSLLIEFLAEILTLSHATHIIFCSVEFAALSDKYLMARISGTKTEKFNRNVKGVSYDDTDIIRNNSGYYTTDLIFDTAKSESF